MIIEKQAEDPSLSRVGMICRTLSIKQITIYPNNCLNIIYAQGI